MVDLFLDGYVLACPDIADGAASASRFVLGLVDWHELRNAEWTRVFISSRVYDALVQEDSYPAIERLAALIQHYHLNVSTRDVVTLVNSLLNRVPTFEDHFGIAEVVARDVVISTTMLDDGRPATFRAELEWLLLRLAAAHFFGRLAAKNRMLISKLRETEFEDVEIRAEADCCIVSPDDIRFKCAIQTQMRTCATLSGLFRSIDVVDLWLQGRHNAALFQPAINAALVQRGVRVADVTADPPVHRWRFGPAFLGSAARHGFQTDAAKVERLLRACCSTILEEDLTATHVLRTGQGGNNPQRKRGNDGAWRRDIDYEYHLHYWSTPAGPEFADVVAHNVFSITE